MTSYKVLMGLEFGKILTEAEAQTAAGSNLLNKFRKYMMTSPESCGVVNGFIEESSTVCDSSLQKSVSIIKDYINTNKTSWALATACESILNTPGKHNYLFRNAARQVEKLLEQNEDQIVAQIKAGSLKNIMFCENFRSIAKQVFANNVVIEAKANYTVNTPVGITECSGDNVYFALGNQLFSSDKEGSVNEASWDLVSESFKHMHSLMISQLFRVNGDSMFIQCGKDTYKISEAYVIEKIDKDNNVLESYSPDQFREYAGMAGRIMSVRVPKFDAIMECIAMLAENYDNVQNLDHVKIYSTSQDKFFVIESGSNLYASLIASTRHPYWKIEQNVVEALSFIKAKTNAEIGSEYTKKVQEYMEQVEVDKKAELEKLLQESESKSLKEQINEQIERFKDNPQMLKVLAGLAAEAAEALK